MMNNFWLIGSRQLELNNCKDTDIIVLDKKYFKYYRDLGYDVFTFHKNKINYDIKRYNLFIHNYQFDYRLIGNDFPYHYDFLKNRKQVIQFLYDSCTCKFIESGLCKCFWISKNNDETKYIQKEVYKIAVMIFFLQNNKMELTDDQKEIVQKIHDYNMPIDYIDTLKQMIYELKDLK